MKRVVVVGNGMVGHRLCAKLRERAGPDRLEIVAFGEEPRPAYDRVHLSSFFSGSSAEDLLLAPRTWYAERDVELRTGERVVRIDRGEKRVVTSTGVAEAYDALVLATGSAPFVPATLSGVSTAGVFVYRTIEDLEAIAAYGAACRSGTVLRGAIAMQPPGKTDFVAGTSMPDRKASDVPEAGDARHARGMGRHVPRA